MSVPAVVHLIHVSTVERVESYILSPFKLFYKSRHSTLILVLNDNKAVLPASFSHVRSISAVRINTN
jgi:hypothetical protein